MVTKMILVVKNLYVKRNNRMILKGVNLNIRKNEIHAIIGPNGSGKSTLSYSLMGCSDYKIVSGEIIFKGKETVRVFSAAELDAIYVSKTSPPIKS